MKKNIKESCVEKILGICFFTIGVLMLVIALVCAFFSWNTKNTSEKVTGTITEIYNSRGERSTGNSGITVEYSYHGQEYEGYISEYSSSMWVGKDITLYVNKEDPHQVRTVSLLYLPTLILGCIAVPFSIIGGVFLLIVRKRKKRKQYLLQNGRQVMAEVTGGRLNYNYAVNGRHPWKMECKYEDIYSGELYLFSSENIWIDPEFYIGQQVTVYVDANNYRKYYVDVEGLLLEENSGVQIHDYR
ncbi:MAG: DUF3592 domain-containing protein [Lachnospiraceae bacterium]|nr:DUF3592 domain-containing protein [Lachnospiraceae bacterium]